MYKVYANMSGPLMIDGSLQEKTRLVTEYNKLKKASNVGYTRTDAEQPNMEINFSHYIDKIYLMGETVFCDICILETDAGKRLINLLKNHTNLVKLTTIYNKHKKSTAINRVDFIISKA